MRKSVFVSVIFGVIAFIIAFALGSILTLTTGIPLIGSLLNGVLTGMVLTIGLLSRRFYFSATIMWLAFSLCATMTTTLGPPGLYKVIIGLCAGILWDLLYSWIARYRNWGLILGGLIGSASIMFTLILFLRVGFVKNAFEALQKYEKSFWLILALNLIITFFGVMLGLILYNKRLKKLTQFKNLSQ